MFAKWSGMRENAASAAEERMSARNAQEDGGGSKVENGCGMCRTLRRHVLPSAHHSSQGLPATREGRQASTRGATLC